MLVRALKSFRAGSGAKLMRPGEEVEVNDELAETLLSRGIAVAVDADITAGDPGDDTQDAGGDDSDGEASDSGPDPEAKPDPDLEPVADVVEPSGYPPLPNKSAPVSEWEEYARRNEISLTNLRSRNEKIGYIQKVVSGE